MSTDIVPSGDSDLPEKPPAYADIVLTKEHEQEMRASWPDKTEAAQRHNMKMRIRVQAMHRIKRNDGTRYFGGPQPNSGPKKTRRVGQAVLEAAESRTKEITDAIFAPLSKGSDATDMERHKAGMGIAKLSREEEQLQMQLDEFARKTNEEVLQAGVDVVMKLIKGGKIDLDSLKAQVDDNTVDGTIEEA
jgi:hypothetical protein